MSSNNNTRERRLNDGLCPNCGTRLYKISKTSTVMNKLFKKKHSSDSADGEHAAANSNVRKTALTIPGVVERGQCVKCADGHEIGFATTTASGEAVPVPIAKAVPVVEQATPLAAVRVRLHGVAKGKLFGRVEHVKMGAGVARGLGKAVVEGSPARTGDIDL